MSFLKLIPLLILAGAIGAFADTSIINNAPWWVNAVLAFVGAGALGGGGVWAWLGNLIGQKNKSIQFARPHPLFSPKRERLCPNCRLRFA